MLNVGGGEWKKLVGGGFLGGGIELVGGLLKSVKRATEQGEAKKFKC